MKSKKRKAQKVYIDPKDKRSRSWDGSLNPKRERMTIKKRTKKLKRGRRPVIKGSKREKIMISISPEALKKANLVSNRSRFIDYAILDTEIPKNMEVAWMSKLLEVKKKS